MPAILRSRYEQYKRDTRHFTTWLANTAISLGYPLAQFDKEDEEADDEPPALSANAKKNARKKAKAKEKKLESAGQTELADEGKTKDLRVGEQHLPAAPGPVAAGRYALKLSRYSEVAQYIVEKGVSIPTDVIKILKRCVTLRLKALRRFAASADPKNETHRYFVNVLIKIGGLFEKTNRVSDTQSTPLSNSFSALSVDETEDDAEDMSVAEAVNAVIIFLEDLETTRVYVMELWKDYKNQALDLVTAAVTTNTALELLKKPHDDLMKRVMPVFNNDFQFMMWAVFVVLRGRTTGQPALDMPAFNLVDPADTNIGHIYDFLMTPFMQNLGGLAQLISDQTVPVYKPGYFGSYNPRADFSKFAFPARWQQYQILLAESFTDIYFLLSIGDPKSKLPGPLPKSGSGSIQSSNLFFLDETIRLMDRFIKAEELSFHLAFAMRILVDINLSLGPNTSRGQRQLKETAGRMVKCLKARRAVEGNTPPANWDAENEVIINHFVLEASYYADFDLRQLKNVPGLQDGGWLLVERDPMLCGLLLFRLQIKYQDLGFALTNTWASILYAAHLYEACRHSGQLPGTRALPSWPDMDLVLQLHGKEQAFGGRIPTNVDESNSAFETVAGFSPEAVQASRMAFTNTSTPRRQSSQVPEVWSKTGPIPFHDQTKILPIYKRKFITDVTTGIQYDINSIEGLLRDIKIDQDKANRRQNKSKKSGCRKEKKHRAPKYSLTQLLSVLEEGLHTETTSIRFDYVSMHLLCLHLFRNVKRVSHDYLLGKLGPAYQENDSQLPYLTDWILRFAAFSFRQYEQVSGTRLDRSLSRSRLLLGATEEIRKLLEKKDEGQKESLRSSMIVSDRIAYLTCGLMVDA